MTSKAVVKMNVCSKTHRIEVSMRDDGDLDVGIESDCPNVREYARRLTRMTVADATDFCGSVVVDRRSARHCPPPACARWGS